MNVLIIPLSLFILIILTTLTIYFVEKLMHVAIFFTVFNILIGIFYISLGYTLLGIFQITVYSVSMATLFFYIVCLIGGEDNKEE